MRAFFQDLLTPLQRRMLDGCHANRRFEDTLAASPFELDSLVHTAMPTIIPTIVPMVVGSARRADFNSSESFTASIWFVFSYGSRACS